VSLSKSKKNYLAIVSHYESCLERYGDTHLGVDWPKKEDADRRYEVMLALVRPALSHGVVDLLDFGCGASHFYEYILRRGITNLRYSGLDLSTKFCALSRKKFPANNYYCVDLLDDTSALPQFEYVIMNGVFTEKQTLSFDEMFLYFKRLVKKVFLHCTRGMAFNVMSKHVDWERQDLFHVPFDLIAEFLTREVSREFVFRSDYRLYEYTTYVYK